MTSVRSPDAVDVARQLLAREPVDPVDPAATAAALQRVYERVSRNLRRSVGDDGYNALMARVLARSAREHPVLKDLHPLAGATVDVERVMAGIGVHGAAATTAAFEAMLATLADVLSGLIGADMVLNLLDPDSPNSHASGDRPSS